MDTTKFRSLPAFLVTGAAAAALALAGCSGAADNTNNISPNAGVSPSVDISSNQLVHANSTETARNGMFSIGSDTLTIGESTLSDLSKALGDQAAWVAVGAVEDDEDVPLESLFKANSKTGDFASISENTIAGGQSVKVYFALPDKDGKYVLGGFAEIGFSINESGTFGNATLQSVSFGRVNQTATENTRAYGLPLIDVGSTELDSEVSYVRSALGKETRGSKTEDSSVEKGDEAIEMLAYEFKKADITCLFWTGRVHTLTISARDDATATSSVNDNGNTASNDDSSDAEEDSETM